MTSYFLFCLHAIDSSLHWSRALCQWSHLLSRSFVNTRIRKKVKKKVVSPLSWIDGVSPEVLAYIHGMPKPRPENLHCAKYYFEEGHRRVTPYYYVYEEYFKSEPPEASRTVWGHLSRGIPLITKEFVQHRINEGQIFVNLEPIRSGKNAAFSLLFFSF